MDDPLVLNRLKGRYSQISMCKMKFVITIIYYKAAATSMANVLESTDINFNIIVVCVA